METTTDTAKSETTSDSGGATASDGAKSETTSDGGSGSDGASKSYSRGENQKPVTDAYRENWNNIFRRGKPRRR